VTEAANKASAAGVGPASATIGISQVAYQGSGAGKASQAASAAPPGGRPRAAARATAASPAIPSTAPSTRGRGDPDQPASAARVQQRDARRTVAAIEAVRASDQISGE